MIKIILWDADGTLLDFEKSEKYCIGRCLEEIGFSGYDDAMLARYGQINDRYWKALERGEISKQEVLTGRFRTFFESEHIPCDDVEAFNQAYQKSLGEHFFENENSLALCRKLCGTADQYIVTNGTAKAQKNKLRTSGLESCMKGVFISDEIGVEKPGKGFFDAVFQTIGPVERSSVMIVGDSLTSDMKGGNHAGIRCCWYNPHGKLNTAGVRIDYEIRNLWEVEQILEDSRGRI